MLRLLAVVLVLGNFSATVVNGMPLANEDTPHSRVSRQAVARLMRRTYDFSTTCPSGISLKVNDNQINRGNLRLSAADAATLAGVLYDRPLEERVEVWCKVAQLTQELAASIGRIVTTFDVKDLGLYQGDILITKDTVDAIVGHEDTPGRKQRTLRPSGFLASQPRPSRSAERVKRKVISSPGAFWDGGIVPWRFDSNALTSSTRNLIRQAIASWEEKTCLRFPERNNPGGQSHVRFIVDNGCYSYIGKFGTSQPISIGFGCETLGIIAHEIGHAIGFAHEQSRPDRDRYVRINFSNVRNGLEGNFFSGSWTTYQTENTPYDYSSLMHYASRDFAVDSSRDVLEATDPSMRNTMGQREDLSFWDTRAANNRYCSTKCGGTTLDWEECDNGGYRNPNKCDECNCPLPWAPPFCKEPVTESGCGSTSIAVTTTTGQFSTAGYSGSGMPVRSLCSYRFTAPEGMRVKVKFIDDFTVRDSSPIARAPACGSFVEIRNENQAITGPRFCGLGRPQGDFVSHGNELVFVTNNFLTSGNRARLEYSAESCGGCSASSATTEPACLRTELYSCDNTSPFRKNLCFDVNASGKYYCCTGYIRTAGTCTRDPSVVTTTTEEVTTTTEAAATTTTEEATTTTEEATTTTEEATTTTEDNISEWSPWTRCFGSCGRCGIQYRRSICREITCPITFIQLRRCQVEGCVEQSQCSPSLKSIAVPKDKPINIPV